MGNNANYGGPIAFQIIRTYMDLTLVNVNKRFGLKPSGQTASTGSYKGQKKKSLSFAGYWPLNTMSNNKDDNLSYSVVNYFQKYLQTWAG